MGMVKSLWGVTYARDKIWEIYKDLHVDDWNVGALYSGHGNKPGNGYDKGECIVLKGTGKDPKVWYCKENVGNSLQTRLFVIQACYAADNNPDSLANVLVEKGCSVRSVQQAAYTTTMRLVYHMQGSVIWTERLGTATSIFRGKI
ncbi:hypothetical protein [Archaeoglobus sp.]